MTSFEVKTLRAEARQLKEALAEATVENRLLKKKACPRMGRTSHRYPAPDLASCYITRPGSETLGKDVGHGGPIESAIDGVLRVNIAEAAHASGVPAKMVRYYESIGLIQPAKRRANGYRQYELLPDVYRLRFIRMARDVGLSLTDVRELLALWDDRKRSSGEIKMMALAKIAELQRRLRDVDAMIDTLHEPAKTGKNQHQKWSGMDDARAPSRTSGASRTRKL